MPTVNDRTRSVALQLSLLFKRATGVNVVADPHVAMTDIQSAMTHFGSVSFGETHGVYSHADSVERFIPYAAAKGADRLYVEFFHRRNQHYIDQWQDHNDPSGLVWLMNVSPSFSEHMWAHFFKVLKAAKDNGMRVITMQPDTLDSVYPGMEIFYRNMMFENVIRADQKAKGGSANPYVVYCGEWHVDRAKGMPLHVLLEGAGVRIVDGKFGLFKPIGKTPTAVLSVPAMAHQTPVTFQPVQRNARAHQFVVN